MERGKGSAARFGAKGWLIRRTSALSIELGHSAEHDLAHGIKFYERQEVGLGSYFLDSLIADIESLQVFAGVHPRPIAGFHRALSRRFPFAIYYDFAEWTVYVAAVLDCRQSPTALRSKLRARRRQGL